MSCSDSRDKVGRTIRITSSCSKNTNKEKTVGWGVGVAEMITLGRSECHIQTVKTKWLGQSEFHCVFSDEFVCEREREKNVSVCNDWY